MENEYIKNYNRIIEAKSNWLDTLNFLSSKREILTSKSKDINVIKTSNNIELSEEKLRNLIEEVTICLTGLLKSTEQLDKLYGGKK